MPLAALATLLFAAAALLHLTHVLPLISRASLYLSALLSGLPSLIDSVYRLFTNPLNAIDTHLLMSLAAVILIVTGAVFESALLTLLYLVSNTAEHAVQARARKSLDTLRDAAPQHAYRLAHDGRVQQVPISSVAVGDKVLVRAGELVPCDGLVVEGTAFVSTHVLTGESRPDSITVGQSVAAGAKAEDAPIVVQVSAVGAESSLARIARLVTAAEENRPAVANFFDRFGRLYARIVLMLSAVLAAAMPVASKFVSKWFGGEVVRFAGSDGSFVRALGVLVTASPCALMVGAPVAYVAALSCCARRGVLAKSGAKSLEAASRVTDVVFDKTGTLTTGNLTLMGAATLPKGGHHGNGINGRSVGNGVPIRLDKLKTLEHSEFSRVVGAAAALERGAVHPVAAAVRERADQIGGELPVVSKAKVIAGQGVEGVLSMNSNGGSHETLQGRLGRPSYILGRKDYEKISVVTEEASSRGETVSVLEIGDERYLLRLRDDVRPESRDVVRDLREKGLSISVLTGDAQGAADFVSSAMGGGVKVIADATPEQKLDYVVTLGKKLEQKNRGVLMVGDGVNDAAALAASLVGVACGLTSATAVHAADVVLVREDLHNLWWFLRKAKQTKSIVRQNLAIAIVLMLISTSACVAGAVPLWLAVTLHEGGTLFVGLNALRLLRE